MTMDVTRQLPPVNRLLFLHPKDRQCVMLHGRSDWQGAASASPPETETHRWRRSGPLHGHHAATRFVHGNTKRQTDLLLFFEGFYHNRLVDVTLDRTHVSPYRTSPDWSGGFNARRW